MAEQERNILYKLKPALQGDSVVDATDVELGSTFTGLFVGANDPEDALRRFDATGIGAAITEFTGSFSADSSTQDTWFNGRAGVHLQGADGQSNASRTLTLPGTTAINTALDQIVADNLPATFTMLVSYFGGSSSSSISNRLTVNARSGGPAFGFTGRIVLNRGDSATIQISRDSDGNLGQWELLSRGVITTESGQALDDIQLQTRTWANRDGTFLPGSDDVLKGYAFRVTASNPNDGTLRQGLVDAGVTGKVIYDGDWVVWSADSYTSWTDGDNWFVLPADNVFRISQQANNFLTHVNETDTPVDTRLKDTGITGDALIWITNTDGANGGILTEAPFLNPSTDTSRNPSGSDTLYIGGRELQTNDDDFETTANHFQSLLYIVINDQMVSTFGLSNIYLQAVDLDDVVSREINVNDMFVKPSFNDNSTGQYFVYSQYKINDSLSQFRYTSNERLRLIARTQDRHFTLDSTTVDTTSTVSNLQESQLSQVAQAKLNKQTSLQPIDRRRLDDIETTSSTDALANNFAYKVKFGEPSHLESDYRDWNNSNGLLQDFTTTFVYTVRVNADQEITGVSFTGSGAVMFAEITPSLFDNERTYRVSIPPAPDDINYDPLDHPVGFTGTQTSTDATGLSPTIKVDADNFEQAFLDSIVNHADTALPAPLQALNNQATVTHFDNVDFTSNNEHAGIGSMFAFLKLRPDERLGDTPPTDNNLTNEITNSSITATIDDRVGLFYPRDIAGNFDDGVDTPTNGALTGPGSVNEAVTITSGSESNFRLVLGFWFDSDPIPDNTIRNLIRVKERGQSSFRRLFGVEGFTRINEQSLVETGILITERVQGAAGTSVVVPVPHHLYTTQGELIHVFTGIGAAETLFRVNEARTYTVSAALTANGNAEGTDSVDVTIADINQSQDFGTHTLNFTASGHPHTQQVRIEYVASSSTYGGPGHTLRVELPGGLNDNSNFDIDHLSVSAGYTTQETISTPTSYAEANAGGTPLIKSRKKHRMIISFRQSSSNDNLQAHYVVTGFDNDGSPVVSSSNVVDFGYSVFDLDWTQVKLGNNNMFISQNIQGFFLNTDTPLAQFPTHAVLNGWITSHDDKASDYVWGNASAPSRNIEVVRFVENVNFENLVIPDTENTDRFRLTISNGILTPVKIT